MFGHLKSHFLRSRNYCAVAGNRNYHMVFGFCAFGGGFLIPNLALVQCYKQCVVNKSESDIN